MTDPQPLSEASTDAGAVRVGEASRTNKHVTFGAFGLGIGLIGGIAIGLLLPIAIGAAVSAFAPSPISAAVETCAVEDDIWILVGDNGDSISISSEGDEAPGADYADIACVLSELDVPDSLISRIDSTRALDGRQSGEWNDFTASWGYHPDDGLDIVIELG